jgi:hypothetical protein
MAAAMLIFGLASGSVFALATFQLSLRNGKNLLHGTNESARRCAVLFQFLDGRWFSLHGLK